MKKRTAIFVSLIVLVSLFAGCSAKDDSGVSGGAESDMKAVSEESIEYYEEMPMEAAELAEQDGGWEDDDSNGIRQEAQQEGTGQGEQSRKRIKAVNISMETKEFDQLVDQVKTSIKEKQGFTEQSQINGNSYNRESAERSANLTIRIPAESLDAFTEEISALGNVVHQFEQTQDVTYSYKDTERRIKSLEAQQSRVLELIEGAEDIKAVLDLESRLAEIRYELEQHEAILNQYDDQVAYSTVILSIQEVDRITEPESESLGEQMKNRLSDSLYTLNRLGKGVLVWLVGALPFLIPAGVIGGVIWFAVRKKKRIKK